jgi:hypothetical protein
MSTLDEELERARAVKAQHERELLHKANVVSVGITLEKEDDEEENAAPTLVVGVTEKVPEESLSPDDRIPEDLEGIPVRVDVVGHPRAQRRGLFSRLFRRRRHRAEKETEDYD